MLTSPRTTVLVVDDDPSIRSFLTAALQDADYRVLNARDGAEALELFAVDRPELVLIDQQMPVMTGVEFFVSLRARRVRVPVLLMSAGTNARAEAIAYGLDGYLAKPFSLDSLLALVAEWTSPGQRPAAEASLCAKEPAAQSPILIVNANEALLHLVGAAVEDAGIGVLTMHPAQMGGDVAAMHEILRKHDPRVVVYDISLPYGMNWARFQRLQEGERLGVSNRQFVLTTANKRALEQIVGPAPAIELVGDRVNLAAIVQAILLAAVVEEIHC